MSVKTQNCLNGLPVFGLYYDRDQVCQLSQWTSSVWPAF